MKNNFYQNVGEKIKSFRKKKRFSQKELAEKLGKSSSTFINLIESGKRRVSLENLIMIADALETPLYSFLEQKDNHLSSDAILELALNSQPDLTSIQRNMILEFIRFLKEK